MTLSYPVWGVEHGKRVILYKKGRNDVHFVLFVTVLFTFLRHVVMNYLFAPFANYFIRLPQQTSNGVDERTKERRKRAALRKKQHAVSRFAEQGWSMLYCLVMESVGLVSPEHLRSAESFSCCQLTPDYLVSNSQPELARTAMGYIPLHASSMAHKNVLSSAARLVVPPGIRDQH